MTETVFCPQLSRPQGSIFAIRHGGDSESASKNTAIYITFIPSGPFQKDFLIIWASDLVEAGEKTGTKLVPDGNNPRCNNFKPILNPSERQKIVMK